MFTFPAWKISLERNFIVTLQVFLPDFHSSSRCIGRCNVICERNTLCSAERRPTRQNKLLNTWMRSRIGLFLCQPLCFSVSHSASLSATARILQTYKRPSLLWDPHSYLFPLSIARYDKIASSAPFHEGLDAFESLGILEYTTHPARIIIPFINSAISPGRLHGALLLYAPKTTLQ